MTRLLALTLLVLAAAPALARAATAPGRVAYDVGLPSPARHVDSDGATSAVGLPDGGAVMLGSDGPRLHLAAVRRDGRPDPAFGVAGVARVDVPGGAFSLLDALRRPDGRIVVVGAGRALERTETPQLLLVGLRPDGALDPAFGERGIARVGIQGSCANCSPAALAPDGSIVVTGNTGSVPVPDPGRPVAAGDQRWVVTRITASGRPDTAFGVRPVPGTTAGMGAGYGAAVLPDGRIALLGSTARQPSVTRLMADGTPDPGFAGGAVVPVAQGGLAFTVAADGATTVLTDRGVVRLAPDGRPDGGFGGGDGRVDVAGPSFAQLAAGPGGDVLVYAPASYEPRPAARPAFVIDRVDPAGNVTRHEVRADFGGGLASFFGARRRAIPAPALAQNAFRVGELVVRPDGTLLAAGGVSVVQYTGEGAGFSTARFAATALTARFGVDPAFGGAPTAARLSLALVRQRARGARAARGVAVQLSASDAGLVLVRVRDRRGRVLAEGVEPVYRRGRRVVRVPLTRAGLQALRRRTAVRVGGELRDVLAARAGARTVRGTLR